jgi:5-methylcytosine-specific restriction protein A
MPVRPPTFKPRGQRTRREVNAEFDARRGSARARGYDSRWDRASLRFKRQHPLCLGCQAVDRLSPTTVTDHVIPHRGDHDLMWDERNWQAACEAHHNVVKQTLERMHEAGRIKASELRLDSQTAVRLTRELLER